MSGSELARCILPRTEVGLEPVPRSASIARGWVAQALSAAGLEGYREAVELLTSELVTNGIVHVGTPLTLSLESDGERIHLEVEDRSLEMPRSRLPSLRAESGRGLMVVKAMADRWGAYRDGQFKRVWCEVDLREGHGEDPSTEF